MELHYQETHKSQHEKRTALGGWVLVRLHNALCTEFGFRHPPKEYLVVGPKPCAVSLSGRTTELVQMLTFNIISVG